MIRAGHNDRTLVADILTKSFDANQSVNYLVKQDAKRVERVRALMEYSFDVCRKFGEVYLSEDKKACALILYPDQKRTSLQSIGLDVKLILRSIGITNISKALQREAKIKKIQPKQAMTYLWFIGVYPEYQNLGLGTNLLKNIIEESRQKNRPLFLETSTLKNIPWYTKFGFKVYSELDLSYKLFFLKKDIA